MVFSLPPQLLQEGDCLLELVVIGRPVQKRHWYPEDIGSLKLYSGPPPQPVAVRNQVFKTSFGSQQQGFEARTRGLLQTAPLLDGHEDSFYLELGRGPH